MHIHFKRLISVQAFLLLAIAGLVIFFLAYPSDTHAGNVNFTFSRYNKNVSIGGSFTLNTNLEVYSDTVYAMKVVIKYDPDVLELSKSSWAMNACSISVPETSTAGNYVVTRGCPYPGVKQSGKIASFTFKAKKAGSTVISFGEETNASNENGMIASNLGSRTVTVVNSTTSSPRGKKPPSKKGTSTGTSATPTTPGTTESTTTSAPASGESTTASTETADESTTSNTGGQSQTEVTATEPKTSAQTYIQGVTIKLASLAAGIIIGLAVLSVVIYLRFGRA